MVASMLASPQISRILIVDDDLITLQALPATLSLRLYRVAVDATSSPYAALGLHHQQPYDVILSDVQMPDMNGLTFLREIKQITKRTSVILMSAYADPAMAKVAEALGAEALLSKPLDRETLAATLKHILKDRAQP